MSILRRFSARARLPDPKALDGVELVSVDVFDTVLLRRPVSERERLLRVAHAAVRHPALAGTGISAEALWTMRLQARRLAYRVGGIEDPAREVTLADMLRPLAAMLGLPESTVGVLATLEVEEDARSVRPSRRMLAWLRTVRARGIRVVALSDTAYSGEQLIELLSRHGAARLFDHVYASSELGQGKRLGGAFPVLLARENVRAARVLHLGDDPVADLRSPERYGIRALQLPRPPVHAWRHRLAAAGFEATRRRPVLRGRGTVPATPESAGLALLGPVIADHCLHLWLYLANVRSPGTVALFCARGGLRIELAFRTVVERLGLPVPCPIGPLMVSRLVATRAALLREAPCAYQELEREFQGETCAQVAHSLVPGLAELGEEWDQPYDSQLFRALVADGTGAEAFASGLIAQAQLFERHLCEVAGSARRVLLCDTGLCATTQKLLESGFPEWRWESVLLARANYKGFDAPHFARATGLMLERDSYSPVNGRSAILRYWHLVEDVFEPSRLKSVRLFEASTEGVRANLEEPGWRERIGAEPGEAFQGVMRYLDSLRQGDTGRVLAEAGTAWSRLAAAIRFPSRDEARALAVSDRSTDFGRTTRYVPALTDLRNLRRALWREGVLAQELGRLSWPLLILVEFGYSARILLRALRRGAAALRGGVSRLAGGRHRAAPPHAMNTGYSAGPASRPIE